MFIAGTREIANGALGYLQPHYKYIYAKELTILYTKIGKDYEWTSVPSFMSLMNPKWRGCSIKKRVL